MSGPIRGLVALLIVGGLAATGVYFVSRPVNPTATETIEPAKTVVDESVEVTRRNLEEDLSLNATISYGEATALPIEADGIVTAAPEQDDILRPGDEVVRVNDRPITLADGDVPLYRELRRVGKWDVDDAGDRLGFQEGGDVEQLQRFLVGKGFDDDGRLEVDGVFGLTTERAVKAWQKDAAVPATGRVDRSQLLFIDEPVRVESVPAIGDRFDQITVGALRPIAELQVSNRQRSYFVEGTEVTIETDAGMSAGIVTKVERTVGADGSTQYSITIEFTNGDAPADVTTAEVTSVRLVAENVTAVPVRTLVALAEGGWAVQLETPSGPTLTAIELGNVVEGMAEITGLDEGARVVIPS